MKFGFNKNSKKNDKIRIRKSSKKVMHIPARLMRQIELLEKYYDIDIENRVITIELHYENVSDVLANDVSYKDLPQFSNDVIERVNQLVDSFPAEFSVDLKLKFDNYCGYDPNKLMSGFKDSLEMFHYSYYKERKYTWLIAAILVVVSASLIGFRLFAINAKIIPDSGILQEMIDICGWVFLWEAVSIVFLTQSEKKEISKHVISYLVNISFSDAENNVLVNVNHEELIKTWVFETKKQKTGRILLLIGGAGCLALSIIRFFDGLTGLINVINATEASVAKSNLLSMGINLGCTVIFALAAIGALSMFREKGPLQKFVAVIAWIMFILDIGIIVLITAIFIIFKVTSVADIFGAYISIFAAIIVDICYFIGYRMTIKNTKVIDIEE